MGMSQTGTGLNRITIVAESPLSQGTIVSCLRRSETSWGQSEFDPRPAPPIIHVFFTDSQGFRVKDPIGD